MSFDLIGALALTGFCILALAVFYGSGAHRRK